MLSSDNQLFMYAQNKYFSLGVVSRDLSYNMLTSLTAGLLNGLTNLKTL